MIKNFLKVLMPFLFTVLLLGCKTLSCEKSESIDFESEDTFLQLEFSKDSDLVFYILRLESLQNDNLNSFSGLDVTITNELKEKIRIKIQIENDDHELICESGIFTILNGENKSMTFNFEEPSENINAACITFCIEGKLSDGTICMENFNLITE